jgi:hypothetical protein
MVACEWSKATGVRDIEDVRQDSRKLGMPLGWIRDCWRGCGVASRRGSFLLDIAVPFIALYPFPASTLAGAMFAIVR